MITKSVFTGEGVGRDVGSCHTNLYKLRVKKKKIDPIEYIFKVWEGTYSIKIYPTFHQSPLALIRLRVEKMSYESHTY